MTRTGCEDAPMGHEPQPITEAELEDVFRERFPNLTRTSWNPVLRHRFRYFAPDEHYEAMVERHVTEGCSWLDVGAVQENTAAGEATPESLR